MYTIRTDDCVFYIPLSDDPSLQVINPEAVFEVNKVDSLTFTMLPDNVMYGKFKKMVTPVMLVQDGEVIFKGRVVETKTDSYNQQEVFCEGELGYLHDSCVRPYDFTGKAKDLFVQLITSHNEQVEEHKRFEVGIITAIDDDDEADTHSTAYADTLEELRQMFVAVHRGYLRVRTVDGVRYLDYIKEFTDDCTQPIEFGVNLVEIENNIDAANVFSVLVPLGGYNTYEGPVDIKEVNDGIDYIEDADAIAKYGRIVKTYKWEDCKDPKELKERGYEQFTKLKETRTITIKAVDLHIIDTKHEAIRVGKNVRLVSDPHGLNEPDACVKIKLNIEKPDQTEYTFGYPPESLTDSNIAKNRKNEYDTRGLHRWLIETENSFEVAVDALNSMISLKADTILLDGYVKATELETTILTVVEGANVDSMNVNTLVGGNCDFDEMWCGQFNGQSTSWATVSMGTIASATLLGGSNVGSVDLSHSHAVYANADGTITLGEVATTGGSFKIADTSYYKNGVSAAYSEGYEGGKPVSVSRVATYNDETKSYDVTVVVKSADGSTNSFDLVSIDASAVYDAGYQACKDAIWVSAAINSISNVSANTMYAQGYASVFVGEEQVHYQSLSKSQYFSWMGQ